MRTLFLFACLALVALAQTPDPCAAPVVQGDLTASCRYLPLSAANSLSGPVIGAPDALLLLIAGPQSQYAAFEVTLVYEQDGERKPLRQIVPRQQDNGTLLLQTFARPAKLVSYTVVPLAYASAPLTAGVR